MWFRRDLRLSDNVAFTEACRADSVVCAYAGPLEGPHSPGLASRGWASASLEALEKSLALQGSTLTTVQGDPAHALAQLASEVGARAVHCQREWTPEGMALEGRVRDALSAVGIVLAVHPGQLLVEPDALTTGAGSPYRVFTPFSRRWFEAVANVEPPLPAPRLPSRDARPASPVPGPASRSRVSLPGDWDAGESAAAQRLEAFAAGALAEYERGRDLLGIDGTSRLSPHLAWGEVSPRQVLFAVRGRAGAAPFLRQLAWREFAYHTLRHFPALADRPLRREFEEFGWAADEGDIERWTAGRTGFPLVDAGMRQLAETGWMHNRARLVCASFLTKDLLAPWQDGERVFEERLVDFDPAINAFSWQWVAGSGLDAAPYFRIFNPEVQRRRYDADGSYVRRWAPAEKIGPIVDHAEARERALAAYSAIRGRR